MNMKTPYFIIHKEVLDSTVDSFKTAIRNLWPNCLVGYSFKSNAIPWMLDYMRKQGFYAEVVSFDEYSLALSIGYDKDKIVYNGVAKDEDTFKNAVLDGAYVNIDAWHEIRWLSDLPANSKKRIGIRVNIDLESLIPGITVCGSEESRFGICYENGELKKAIDKIKEIPNAQVVGLHLHNSIPSRSLDAYWAISKKACDIISDLDLELEYIDIGGGFFGGLDNKPSFEDYLAIIKERLSKFIDITKTKLIVEPGMSLLSTSMSYVTSVVDVKTNKDSIFVVTDGGRTQIDPMMRKKGFFYEIDAEKYEQRQVLKKQVVTGFTCIETDRLFTLVEMPKLMEGDKIVYHKVGAYTYCSSSNFIKFLPPVYVDDDGEIILVNKEWKAEDFLRKYIKK